MLNITKSLQIEDANGEFSHSGMHELQYKPEVATRKISTQSAVSHHLYTKSPVNLGAIPGSEPAMVLHNSTSFLAIFFAVDSVTKYLCLSFQALEDYEWEFPRHQLKILSMLGEGCFGQVWKYEAEEIGGDMGTETYSYHTPHMCASYHSYMFTCPHMCDKRCAN